MKDRYMFLLIIFSMATGIKIKNFEYDYGEFLCTVFELIDSIRISRHTKNIEGEAKDDEWDMIIDFFDTLERKTENYDTYKMFSESSDFYDVTRSAIVVRDRVCEQGLQL